MSIAVCTLCTRHVDTDFNTDGVWEGTDFYCDVCMDATALMKVVTQPKKRADDEVQNIPFKEMK